MQSNAGSTRRVKYLIAIATGFILSTLAILVSFWATYYASPRMLSEKAFMIDVTGTTNVTLPLTGATGEKLYYELQIESTSSVSSSLLIDTVKGLQAIRVGEGLRIQRRETVYLDGIPRQLFLVLQCGRCTVRGSFSIRYYSVDYTLLLVMNVVAIVSSLIGIGLLTVGCYGYLIERRVKRVGSG
ncbi:MAG: hypothetical protein QXJ38_01950 [Thermofilaceae archaeon]